MTIKKHVLSSFTAFNFLRSFSYYYLLTPTPPQLLHELAQTPRIGTNSTTSLILNWGGHPQWLYQIWLHSINFFLYKTPQIIRWCLLSLSCFSTRTQGNMWIRSIFSNQHSQRKHKQAINQCPYVSSCNPIKSSTIQYIQHTSSYCPNTQSH